jgi:predicted acetyltransferase
MSKYTVTDVQNFEYLWELFLIYLEEVSIFFNEMAPPEKNVFLKFWQLENKWTYFLNLNNKPIGFVLLQLVSERDESSMEVGAIFVSKEYRGLYHPHQFQHQGLRI